MDHYEVKFGLMRAQKSHPDVNFRYVMGPTRDLPNKIVPVEFTTEEVKRLIKYGEQDAMNYFKENKSGTHPKVSSPKKRYLR
jgi:hypothetical protein